MVRKLQISEIYYKNKSKRPVDALAVKAYITHLLTTWNQEMLAHLKKLQLQFHLISSTSINEKCVKYLQKLSDPGRIANEETATHQGARSSKPGEGEEMEEKGVKEDFKAGSENVRDNGGGEDEVVRKLPTRKMSLTRRQSRDLMKKKTSFEEQVLFF